MMNLTRNEIMVLNGMRTNLYGDCIENAQWTFAVIDETSLTEKVARGTISSLVKKGLVTVEGTYGKQDDESQIGFTEEGTKLFEEADGEDCRWGGPKLLSVPEDKPEPKATKGSKTVTVVAFTGMVIGDFEYTVKGSTVTVETKSGTLEFDKKTLVQTNAKNPRFANKIVK